MNEKPIQIALDRFHQECSDAAVELVHHFEFLGLPDTSQLEDIISELKRAIANVMRPWL